VYSLCTPTDLHTVQHQVVNGCSLTAQNMIGLYSNRFGCLGSIVVSVLATLLLALLLRGCGIIAW
jgi:hypothetical protein